jgi:molybdenum cofactor biosynthesis enzyme MoaA
MDLSQNHCFAPWKSLSVKGSKIGTVCCASASSFVIDSWSNVKESSYFRDLQAQTLNTNWPQECTTCRKLRDNKLISRKDFFDKRLSLDTNHEIEWLEVNISNHCNYSCVMCNNEFSTQWHKLESLHHFIASPVPDHYRLSKDDIDNLIRLIQQNPIKSIDIQGGEPFVIPETEYFLEQLETVGYSGTVLIVTNGSKITNKLLRFLTSKMHVMITVSIDCIDPDLYKIIRSPTVPFSVIEKNVELLASLSDNIELNAVLMNLNAYSYNDMDEFSMSKVNKPLRVNWINRPKFLQLNALSPTRKQRSLEILHQSSHKGMYYERITSAISLDVKPEITVEFEDYMKEFCRLKSVSLDNWQLVNS